MVVAPASRCSLHPYKSFRREYEHHFLADGRNIYHTPEWKRIRKARLLLNPLCQPCEELGLVIPAKDVDHKVEVEDGGEVFDIENTQSLCRSCHNRKSALKKRLRNSKKNNKDIPKISDFK